MIMDEDLKSGDRVRHADYGDAVAEIVRFGAYPDAVVRWESTGRESVVNWHYLTKAE